MNTTVSKSFGLALLLAVGIIAVMVAMGAFTSQRAAAAFVGTPTIEADPNNAGATAKITITLTEAVEDLVATNAIVATFPEGFTGLTAGSPPTGITITGTLAGDVTPSASTTATVADKSGKSQLTIAIAEFGSGDNFPSGSPIKITIPASAGIKLPPDGPYDVSVSTTHTGAANASLTVALALGTLDVDPTGAGAVATVTVKFEAINDLPDGDMISIKLADFGVPSSISPESVLIRRTLNAQGKAATGSGNPDSVSVSSESETISILIPALSDDDKGLKAKETITVLIRQSAGITLPTAAAVDKYHAVITTTDPVTNATNTQTTNAIEIKRELSLSPKSGAKGTSVTASGKGWGSTGPVMLWIDDGKGDTTDGNPNKEDGLRNGLEVILAENLAVSGGAFSATFTADTGFTGSTLTVQARDAAGEFLMDNVGRTFTVKGSLSLNKDSVKVNEALEISLSEYELGAVGKITIGGVPQTRKTGDETVTAGKATFTIEVAPTTPLGTQVVSVTVGDETTTATVSVVAVPMTVSPATAALGQEITISATGFNAKQQIDDVKVGGQSVTTDSNNDDITNATRLTDNNGNITIRIVVPHAAGTGDRLIRIEDLKGRTGEARLNIPAPTLTLSASESRRSSRVTATGTGFVADDSILLNYAVTTTRTRSVGTATTNSVGEWSVQFVVPADAGIGETHSVTATSSAKGGADGTTAISTKSADHKVPGAGFELDPAEAASGETIKITGSSFRGYSSVDTLSIGGIELSTVGIQTNAEGSFVANVTVPQLAPGTHNVFVDIGEEEISEQLVIPLDTTQTVEDVFFDLIANESLQTIWRYDFDTRTWTSYTTDPETSFSNNLFEVESSDILNINVSSEQTFSHQKGSSLFEGWNLITLN